MTTQEAPASDLDRLVEELEVQCCLRWGRLGGDLDSSDAVQAFNRLPTTERKEVAMRFLERAMRQTNDSLWRSNAAYRQTAMCALGRRLLSDRIPIHAGDIERLCALLSGRFRINLKMLGFVHAIARHAERLANQDPTLKPRLYAACTPVVVGLLGMGWKAEKKLGEKLYNALSDEPHAFIERGEAWSDAAVAALDAMPPAERALWNELLALAANATAGAPTAKWNKQVDALLDRIGRDRFAEVLSPWLALIDRPRTKERPRDFAYEPDWTHRIIDPHMQLLKGLCWASARVGGPDLCRALGLATISAYRKIPGLGPRATRIGNAGVYALGQIDSQDALGQLAILRVKVQFGTAQKLIDKALTAQATRLGLSREEIEEIGVPTYGLSEVGLREETIGDYTARLRVAPSGKAEIHWHTAAGKIQKSVPAAVKTGFADDLKELKAAAKDVERMVPAQRDRLDSMFLDNRRWPLQIWRERYLDHPLVGLVARNLIWAAADEGAAPARSFVRDPSSGAFINAHGQGVDLPESATVALWHPVTVPQGEALEWRKFFEDRQIRQPFKQAHREVYLLTDAERTTNVYSNRFAAHVLRQHQFHALALQRGWKNKLRLMVDDTYPPATRTLVAHNIRAEFWIEGIGDDYERDANESGTYNLVATDQVRFYAIDAPGRIGHAMGGGYEMHGPVGSDRPLPLEQVPPLVLSEIMRDVDLFVGVASVGNNPLWNDGGPDGRYVQYWNDYSFGELTEAGKGRRELLERLMPRLKIASVCSLAERHLIVGGRLRTYKIHLGSGNILMEPNDQYLCIVPGQGAHASKDSDVFLPFEGDRTLSIILSKAFMLADDDKIKDPTITRQIRQH